MDKIEILNGEFSKELNLRYAPAIKAGFPSPADDYEHESLDFNRDMIRHPEATFYGRVKGDSMIEAGIFQGDIAVIDRAVRPMDGDVIVAYLDKEYTIKFLDLTHQDEGYIELIPANENYAPIRIDELDNFEVWGVVVWTIHSWQRHL